MSFVASRVKLQAKHDVVDMPAPVETVTATAVK